MSTQNDTTQVSRRARRRLWLSIFGGGFLLIGAAYSLYWANVLRYEQSTDDAYVNGNVVQITPQIYGTVSIALVDGLPKPIRLRIEFSERPMVNGQASGNAERVGWLEVSEQFFRPARLSGTLQQPGEQSDPMRK